jgi:hypothetical protein
VKKTRVKESELKGSRNHLVLEKFSHCFDSMQLTRKRESRRRRRRIINTRGCMYQNSQRTSGTNITLHAPPAQTYLTVLRWSHKPDLETTTTKVQHAHSFDILRD